MKIATIVLGQELKKNIDQISFQEVIMPKKFDRIATCDLLLVTIHS